VGPRRAHELAQAATGKPGGWVHAYLHPVEGDLSNAGYCYRRAGEQQHSVVTRGGMGQNIRRPI